MQGRGRKSVFWVPGPLSLVVCVSLLLFPHPILKSLHPWVSPFSLFNDQTQEKSQALRRA